PASQQPLDELLGVGPHPARDVRGDQDSHSIGPRLAAGVETGSSRERLSLPFGAVRDEEGRMLLDPGDQPPDPLLFRHPRRPTQLAPQLPDVADVDPLVARPPWSMEPLNAPSELP